MSFQNILENRAPDCYETRLPQVHSKELIEVIVKFTKSKCTLVDLKGNIFQQLYVFMKLMLKGTVVYNKRR